MTLIDVAVSLAILASLGMLALMVARALGIV
jgi:hypothetical protein